MSKVNKNFNVKLDIKALDESGHFEGYASVFGIQDFDGDVIMTGAFKKSIEALQAKGKLPKMLWQHNFTMIIGKFTEMREDEHGLWVKGFFILDVQKGKEAYALMKAGELDAMSVGFNIVEAGNGDRGRVITEVDLWEVSLVTWGANSEALVTSVKSIKSEREFEQFLRDAGYSRKEAVRITADGFKVDKNQRDADNELLESLKKLSNTIGGQQNA